jgi:hypothetical protein
MFKVQAKENLLKLAISIINVFILSVGFVFSQEKQTKDPIKDSLIMHHYRQLEQAVKSNPKDTKFYCCQGSIMYIEQESKIYSQSDGTFSGKLYFTKSDFLKWQQWYVTRLNIPRYKVPLYKRPCSR